MYAMGTGVQGSNTVAHMLCGRPLDCLCKNEFMEIKRRKKQYGKYNEFSKKIYSYVG